VACPAAQNLFVHDESAHPHGSEQHFGPTYGTMMEWVRKVQANLRSGNGAFLGLESATARGVVGRRAPSSASLSMVVLTAIVIVIVVGITSYDLATRRRHKAAARKVAAA
jgi:hypothetical protein